MRQTETDAQPNKDKYDLCDGSRGFSRWPLQVPNAVSLACASCWHLGHGLRGRVQRTRHWVWPTRECTKAAKSVTEAAASRCTRK